MLLMLTKMMTLWGISGKKNKADKKYANLKQLYSFPVGYTVALQQEDGGPWTHGTLRDKDDYYHLTGHTKWVKRLDSWSSGTVTLISSQTKTIIDQHTQGHLFTQRMYI